YTDGFTGAINQVFLQGEDGIYRDASYKIDANAPAFNHISPVIDINQDGNLDVLVTRLGGPQFETSGVFFYLGDGQGGFRLSTEGLPVEIRHQKQTDIKWDSTTIDYQFP